MNKSTWMKRFAALLVATLVFALSFATAFASDGDPTLPNLPADGTTGTLTVHKYSTTSSSQIPGDGLPITNPGNLGTPLDNVGFTLYPIVEDYDESAGTGYQVTAATQAELDADFDAFMAAHAPTAYGTGEQKTVAGTTKWENLPMGYYVLVETTPPANLNVAPMAPAIITMPMGITASGSGWNFDVHVYPKNVKLDDVTKEINSSSTIFNVGDTVPYTITGKIKVALRAGDEGDYSYGDWSMADPLDRRLTLNTASVKLIAEGGNPAPIELETDDYTQTYITDEDDEDNFNTVTWALTQDGKDKLAEAGATGIRIEFTTQVNSKALDGSPSGSPTITNTAEMNQRAANTTEIVGPATPPGPLPSFTLAGITIKKIDGNTPTTLLDGAEFKIATSEANARGGVWVQSGVTGQDAIVVTGDNPGTTEVEKGWGYFSGLPVSDTDDTVYYLYESKAPGGYVHDQSVFKVTITAGNKTASIEIQNQKIGDPPVDNPNPSFQLPKTGGIGTIIFAIVGVALMGLAVVVLVKSRKKNRA